MARRLLFVADLTPKLASKISNQSIEGHLKWIGNKPIGVQVSCWIDDSSLSWEKGGGLTNSDHSMY